MKPGKYRKGVEYAYIVTYTYTPPQLPAGTSNIATATGSVTLKHNLTARDMMELIFGYIREDAKLPDTVSIFPSLYYVEEN